MTLKLKPDLVHNTRPSDFNSLYKGFPEETEGLSYWTKPMVHQLYFNNRQHLMLQRKTQTTIMYPTILGYAGRGGKRV